MNGSITNKVFFSFSSTPGEDTDDSDDESLGKFLFLFHLNR